MSLALPHAARPCGAWRAAIAALALATGAGAVRADEKLPAAPDRYFNDYAHIVDGNTAQQLNTRLADFERQTSSQIVVAIYPSFASEDSLDDYCYRVYHAWGVGQQKTSNGAVLFIFAQQHKMRIQTGYGLEGALPDVICKRILEDEIAPHFKQGDYAGGLRAGVDAMLAATKGEYKGTGRTVRDQREQQSPGVSFALFAIILLFVIISSFRRRRGVMYGSGGTGFYGGWGGGWGGGGGGWSGGGGGGGGDSGGFSGGGGDSGGGGASGSW